jgi:hypothetical protein
VMHKGPHFDSLGVNRQSEYSARSIRPLRHGVYTYNGKSVKQAPSNRPEVLTG